VVASVVVAVEIAGAAAKLSILLKLMAKEALDIPPEPFFFYLQAAYGRYAKPIAP
jgi:hypothetical protein